MKTVSLDISLIENNTGQITGVKQNPRDLTNDGFEKAVQSIRDFPEMLTARELVVVGHENRYVVIGGNQRLRALKHLGHTNALCKIVEWTTEQINEFIIKDNVEYGTWNFELLATDWDMIELQEWGLTELPEFNLENEDLEEQGLIDEDEVPAVQIIPITKQGDLWIMGEHRLLCGDSTSIDDVEKLMDGEKADMVFTDPPYGMKKEKEGVLNDNLNYDDLLEFNREWVPLSFYATKDNGSWYCWGTDEPLMDIYSTIIKPMIKNQQATFRNLITWAKGYGQGQNSENTRSYAIADEKCLFVMCGVQGFNNNADNYFEGWEPIRDYLLSQRLKAGWDIPTMKRVAGHSELSLDHWTCKSQWNMPTQAVYQAFQQWGIDNRQDVFNREYDDLKREYENIKHGYENIKHGYYATRAYFNNVHDNFNNVWEIQRHQRDGSEGGHATPKPIELCMRAIKSSSRENEIVLDLFGGSGSTLIACAKTSRVGYIMELDERYCDVIVKRWQGYTGKEAILQSTGQTFSQLAKLSHSG